MNDKCQVLKQNQFDSQVYSYKAPCWVSTSFRVEIESTLKQTCSMCPESGWRQHRASQKKSFIYVKTNELWRHWSAIHFATDLEKS